MQMEKRNTYCSLVGPCTEKNTLLVDTVNKKAQVVVPDRKNGPGVGRSSCCKAQMLT